MRAWGKLLMVSGLALLCMSCAQYRGQYGSRSYVKDSRTIPPITVPAGINSPVAQQYYVVKWPAPPDVTPSPLYPPDPYFLQLVHKHINQHK